MPIKTKVNELELVQEYLKSPFIIKLSQKFRIHVSRVKKILLKHGVEIKRHGEYLEIKLTEEQKNKILEIYTPLFGVSATAKQLNLSRRAVNKFIKESGLKVFSNKESKLFTKDQELEIINLYKSKSIVEISNLFNCSRSVISGILKRNEIAHLNSCESRSRNVKNRRLTLESDIIKFFIQTQSLEKTGEEFSVYHKDLKEILTKNNIKYKTRASFKFTELQEKDIVHLYVDLNKSVTEIARIYNCSYYPIRRVLVSRKIPIKPAGEFSNCISLKPKSKYFNGFYKNNYFRSLNELSFIINYLEKNQLPWKNGEQVDPIIYFDSKVGKNRKYFPDFYVSNGLLIEIKPKVFWKSQNVIDKKKSALIYCQKHNLKYRLVDYPIIINPIITAYKNGNVQFSEDTKEKFLKRYGKYLTSL